MRIAISNLAWDVTNDEEIASLLLSYGIDAIDIAPGKYFPDIRNASTSEIIRVRQWWAVRGISIIGMQALLFGSAGLNMFGNHDVQTSMLSHFEEICRIGSMLGATRLVFGSPKNRDRSSLGDGQVHDIALNFFNQLGNIAFRHGVVICLEPNPPCYGANFMTNSAETARIVNDVSHSAIRMQLDTGAMTINCENPEVIINKYGSLIGHVHASEPDLVVLGEGKTDHANIAAILQISFPDQIVSIEMLQSKNEQNKVAIERALFVAISNYRNMQLIGERGE
jgi:D-psicose/D-tagatose/L-ribulose 3-epimerase